MIYSELISHSCTIQFSMAAFQKLEVISALPPKVGLLRLRKVVGGINRAVWHDPTDTIFS